MSLDAFFARAIHDACAHAVEKKKTDPMAITESEDKKKKSQRAVNKLEKELADATKDLQTLATPTKMVVAVLVMFAMIGVNKRCEDAESCGWERGLPRDGRLVWVLSFSRLMGPARFGVLKFLRAVLVACSVEWS